MDLVTYRIDRENAGRLLFLFHGYSAEQHHLAAYVPLVDPHERFTAVCPRAPHDLPEGDGATWYERTPDGPVPDDFMVAVDAIEGLIREEAARAGVGTEQCVIGGFSQGGFLTLAVVGRAGAPRYAGAWAMCCGLWDVDGFELDLAAAAGTPALVQLGDKDRIISPGMTRDASTALSSAGWLVTERAYDMAHSQTIEMMVDAREWLATVG